jgi:hypothetical protein
VSQFEIEALIRLAVRAKRAIMLRMAYVIEYFRDGVKIGSVLWARTLDDTVQLAKDGLIRQQADLFRIIDDDTGAEVESGRRNV